MSAGERTMGRGRWARRRRPHDPVTKAIRWLLLAGTVLVLAAGLDLFVLTEHTDSFFAWTISSPLTAAFMGAGYLAAACLDGVSARQKLWAVARVPLPAVLVFTTTTFVVTLMHLETFHMDSFFGWAGSSPTASCRRGAGRPPVPAPHRRRRPARVAPLPNWLRMVTSVVAVGITLLGAALVLVPSDVLDWWPWSLTVLTGRAVGAWLVIVGLTAGQAAWQNDWSASGRSA